MITVSTDELDAMLADPDPVVRRRAEEVGRTRLQGGLYDHVRAVMNVLADNTAVHTWPGGFELLAEISWHELDSVDRDLLTRFLRSRPPTHPLLPKVLRAQTTRPPVPDWLIDQHADQIAGAWADTMLSERSYRRGGGTPAPPR